MPFIIDSQEYVKKNTALPTWDELDYEDFKHYRRKFRKRHDGLRGCAQIDYAFETKAFEIPKGTLDLLKSEIPNYKNMYFVAQFMSNEKRSTSSPDFAGLRLGFCVKTRRIKPDPVDFINHVIKMDSSGNALDRVSLTKGVSNFIDRKRFIFDTHKNELFEEDRLGRAHLIDDNLLGFFATAVNLYAYFIIDNQGLSIAFSQGKDIDKKWTAAIKAYDHGTACCPIG